MHSPTVFMFINYRYEFILPLILFHPSKAKATVEHMSNKPYNTNT